MRMVQLLSVLVLGTFFLWLYVAQPAVGPANQGGAAVSAEALKAHVDVLAGGIGPRHAGQPARLNAAADYIRGEFLATGGEVSEQIYSLPGGRGPFRNILASFGPRTGERLIVGAHYDAFGEGPGADDNASGIAGILELARLLGRDTPGLRVDLAAWTLEEPPHFGSDEMGSAQHAIDLLQSRHPVRGVLVLEMIGYFSDAPASQRYPLALLRLFYPSRGNFIAVTGGLPERGMTKAIKVAMRRATDLPVMSFNGPKRGFGTELSDQRNFWARGIPAVMITDTAMFRNPNYHTAADRPETLDYARMAKVVSGVHAALKTLTE